MNVRQPRAHHNVRSYLLVDVGIPADPHTRLVAHEVELVVPVQPFDLVAKRVELELHGTVINELHVRQSDDSIEHGDAVLYGKVLLLLRTGARQVRNGAEGRDHCLLSDTDHVIIFAQQLGVCLDLAVEMLVVPLAVNAFLKDVVETLIDAETFAVVESFRCARAKSKDTAWVLLREASETWDENRTS